MYFQLNLVKEGEKGRKRIIKKKRQKKLLFAVIIVTQ